jgi:hypothetical protein
VRALLLKMSDLAQRVTVAGATLNAMHEVDRARLSVIEVEAQLRRVRASVVQEAA